MPCESGFLFLLEVSQMTAKINEGHRDREGMETILLVEDEDGVSDLTRSILERTGYSVLTAVNGKEALDIYEKEMDRISLVILDLIMPEMDGKQCLEKLLKRDPSVKILVVSGYSDESVVEETLGLGAKGFLGKPYRMKQILRSVREILDSD
jgi:DNA-binding NtrC family response regulator